MAKDLTEPTLGHIVMPITWDGTDFHVLLSTDAGLLEVSVPGPVVCNMMGWDFGAPGWQAVQVDGTGKLQVDVTEIAMGEIRMYAYDGAMWRWVTCDVAGHLQVDLLTIPDGQIKGYLWDGAAWQKVKGLASGVAQVDHDSVKAHTDVVVDHFFGSVAHISALSGVGADPYQLGPWVPEGEVWVITSCCFCCTTEAGTDWRLAIQCAAGVGWLSIRAGTVANVYEFWEGKIYLLEDERLFVQFMGVTDGQPIIFHLFGYKFYAP